MRLSLKQEMGKLALMADQDYEDELQLQSVGQTLELLAASNNGYRQEF
jgi:hypothetical protein